MTGRLLVTLEGHTDNVTGADLSDDGDHALSWGDDTARIWDVQTGEELQVLRPPAGDIFWGDLSDDGSLVAIGETTGIVRVWESATGVELAAFVGHAGQVSPTFNTQGTLILTAGDDGTARIFSCELCRPLPELLVIAQGRLTRSLTGDERAEFQLQG